MGTPRVRRLRMTLFCLGLQRNCRRGRVAQVRVQKKCTRPQARPNQYIHIDHWSSLGMEGCFAGDRNPGLLDCITKTPFFCFIAHPRQIIYSILFIHVTHWCFATQTKNTNNAKKAYFCGFTASRRGSLLLVRNRASEGALVWQSDGSRVLCVFHRPGE